MRLTKLLLPLLSVFLMIASGCTARCHFMGPPRSHAKNARPSFCEGFIRGCNPTTRAPVPTCNDFMEVRCGGEKIYEGPYQVEILGNKIRYTSSSHSERGGPLVLISELPSPTQTLTSAWEKDGQENHSEGFCEWKFDPAALAEFKLLQ